MSKITEIYEELFKLNEKDNSLDIKIFDIYGNQKINICVRKGSIFKNMMKNIINICDKYEAGMKMLAHGVLEISFKERKN